MSFSDDVAKWAKKTNSTMDKAVRAVCLHVNNGLILKTPVDTGRARGNWQASIGNYKTEWLANTDKSGSSTLQKATITSQDAPRKVYYIVNNVPYIMKLEYGWSKQAPSGMMRITAEGVQAAIKRAIS